MADEDAPQAAPEASAPVLEAQVAAAAPDQVIKLLDYAQIDGEWKTLGKVLRVSADEAGRLIAAGIARLATGLEKKISGVE